MGAIEKVLKPQDIGQVELDSNTRTKSHPHLPTGSLVVDFIIGGRPNEKGVPPCPGLPRGRLVNLYGMESSGKTTLALTTAATTIRMGGQVFFVDWENAIDLSYALKLGVPQDPAKFRLVQPPTLQKGIGMIHAAAKAGVDLIIIDSVSAGVPQELMDASLDKIGDVGQVGQIARLWSAYLPKLKDAVSKSGACVIGISQLREKLSFKGGGTKRTTAGGNAWPFYSELRMMLRRIKTEKHKAYNPLTHKMEEAPLGNVVRCKIDKCKVAPTQGTEGEFFIRYGHGIDDVRSIIDIATAHGLVVKSGSWLSWTRQDGNEVKGQGAENMRSAVLDTDGAWKELYESTLRRMATGSDGFVPEEELDDDLLEIINLTGGA